LACPIRPAAIHQPNGSVQLPNIADHSPKVAGHLLNIANPLNGADPSRRAIYVRHPAVRITNPFVHYRNADVRQRNFAARSDVPLTPPPSLGPLAYVCSVHIYTKHETKQAFSFRARAAPERKSLLSLRIFPDSPDAQRRLPLERFGKEMFNSNSAVCIITSDLALSNLKRNT